MIIFETLSISVDSKIGFYLYELYKLYRESYGDKRIKNIRERNKAVYRGYKKYRGYMIKRKIECNKEDNLIYV